MLDDINLINQGLQHIWHPCAQMKDYESFAPLVIKKAQGSYLELNSGQKMIDAISSWWCKSLGHQHPEIKAALIKQLDLFEHVILANTTNALIVELSQKLSRLCNGLTKVFYASEGSSAIEIALKMSVHAQQLRGYPNRNRFIALSNGYHGETLAALSISDLGLYRNPYKDMLLPVKFIETIPYISSTQDPTWHDSDAYWEKIETTLLAASDETAAIIIEPILQGAGGMKIYAQDFLKKLRAFTKAHDIYLVADEILTGFGRTGKMLACEHAEIEPDFLCLGKGLTAGWLPMSAVLTRDEVYDLFYGDYADGKAFLHSHTYSGNALAASVALSVLNIYDKMQIATCAQALEIDMLAAFRRIADKTHCLTNIRSIGGVIAAEIICEDQNRRIGFEVAQMAAKLGALLRPLDRTLYWLPPLNIQHQTLKELEEITEATLRACLF